MTQADHPDQPISKLPTFIQFTRDWKQEVQEHAATVQEGLGRPGVLFDAHVAQIQSDCAERQGDLDILDHPDLAVLDADLDRITRR